MRQMMMRSQIDERLNKSDRLTYFHYDDGGVFILTSSTLCLVQLVQNRKPKEIASGTK